MKKFVTHICETCDKELKTVEEYKECFNNGHDLRTKGQFIIKNIINKRLILKDVINDKVMTE